MLELRVEGHSEEAPLVVREAGDHGSEVAREKSGEVCDEPLPLTVATAMHVDAPRAFRSGPPRIGDRCRPAQWCRRPATRAPGCYRLERHFDACVLERGGDGSAACSKGSRRGEHDDRTHGDQDETSSRHCISCRSRPVSRHADQVAVHVANLRIRMPGAPRSLQVDMR